jgi:hypothetical protein
MVREPDESHSIPHDASCPSLPPYETAGQAPSGAACGPAGAEELLDWLEAHGCTRLEVSAVEGGGVGVRCVCPPGFWLGGGGAVRLWLV